MAILLLLVDDHLFAVFVSGGWCRSNFNHTYKTMITADKISVTVIAVFDVC